MKQGETDGQEHICGVRNLYQQTVDALTPCVCVVGPDGCVTVANRACRDALAATGADTQVGGKSLRDALPILSASSRSKCLQAIRGCQGLVTESRLQSNGNNARATVRVVPLNTAGTKGHSLVIFSRAEGVTENSKSVLDLLEEERERIGRDLHDTLGQQLTALNFLVEVMRRDVAPLSGENAERLGEAAQQVRQLVAKVRDVIRGISPVGPAAGGIAKALRRLTSSAHTVYDIPCHCRLNGVAVLQDEMIANHVFRIAQEALQNALRHAEAGCIDVSLSLQGNTGTLCVADNGVGIESAPSGQGTGMGLRTMRYRAQLIDGELAVQTNPSGGTIVTCRFPVPARGQALTTVPLTAHAPEHAAAGATR